MADLRTKPVFLKQLAEERLYVPIHYIFAPGKARHTGYVSTREPVACNIIVFNIPRSAHACAVLPAATAVITPTAAMGGHVGHGFT